MMKSISIQFIIQKVNIDEFSLHIGKDINTLKNERIVIKSMI